MCALSFFGAYLEFLCESALWFWDGAAFRHASLTSCTMKRKSAANCQNACGLISINRASLLKNNTFNWLASSLRTDSLKLWKWTDSMKRMILNSESSGVCVRVCALWVHSSEKGQKKPSQCAMWMNLFVHLRELFSFLTFSHCRVAAVPSHIIHTNINSWHKSKIAREFEEWKLSFTHFICFTMVLFPDSPAPVRETKQTGLKKTKNKTTSSAEWKQAHSQCFFSLRLVRVLVLMPTL